MEISDKKQLETLRKELNLIDDQLINLLEKRLKIAEKVAQVKDKLNLPKTDSIRESEIIERLKKLTNNLILKDIINSIFQDIFDISKKLRILKKDLKAPFSKIGIIGLGLIGGSIAKAIKSKGQNIQIFTLKRQSANCKLALKNKIINREFKDLAELIIKSEIIILAANISDIIPYAQLINKLNDKIQNKLIVIDVASVKGKITQVFEKLTNDKIEFVATHPMSGSEKSGFIASTSTLFVNNPWIITPHKKNTIEGIDRAENLIKFLGANVMKLGANRHDQLTAKISHLIFMLSIYLYDYAQKSKEALKIAGSGFKTMTRLAHGNKLMHNQILSANKNNIEKELKEFINYVKKSGSIN